MLQGVKLSKDSKLTTTQNRKRMKVIPYASAIGSVKYKGAFERSFSKKDLGEAAYILGIKIYRDRPRRLIRFFNEYIP